MRLAYGSATQDVFIHTVAKQWEILKRSLVTVRSAWVRKKSASRNERQGSRWSAPPESHAGTRAQGRVRAVSTLREQVPGGTCSRGPL